MRLVGKTAIVTGASSGIGYATAKLYAEEGATVIAAARRTDRLEKLAAECEGLGGKIVACTTDLRDTAQLNAMFDKALEVSGTLDILVNNAGVLDGQLPIHETSEEIYDYIYETNQKAVYLCCKRAIEIFLEQNKGGNIINMASAASLRGLKGGTMYITTKHAVLGMTRNIASSFYERGIRCNAILPSNIKTEINRVPREMGLGIMDWQMRAGGAAPLNMITPPGEGQRPILGMPEDVAQLCLFLGDDATSRYISGADIRIDASFLIA